jgi:hypothetical protein
MTGIFRVAFKLKLRDLPSCNKTKRKKAIEKGLSKIDGELDVVNFIRFQFQTRSLLKQLFTAEQRKSAKDLKSHIDSDPSDASDESGNIDPDPFETQEPRE